MTIEPYPDVDDSELASVVSTFLRVYFSRQLASAVLKSWAYLGLKPKTDRQTDRHDEGPLFNGSQGIF